MRPSYFLPLVTGTFALSGCVGMAIDRASNTLADMCEEKGADMRIADPTAESRGGLLGEVVVTGDCLSPDEEGYDEALTIEEYRKRIGQQPR